ncbi:MAG: O-methyltransferase, partial [Chloroflexota bacterium]|nr:O-methyltransferase [Chloroflexota bacterium]
RLQAIAAATIEWSDHASYMIDAAEGQLLKLLVGISGARRILEVGTFTGYSAIAMTEALPADGHVDTLELSSEHAAKAVEHAERAGASARITVHQGMALETLSTLQGPYDMAFIDADKPSYPAYYDAVVPLMRPGGLIVADNVLRRGRVLDPRSSDPGIVGMREFNDRVVADTRVDAVMLTVRDGVTLIRVR